GRTTILRSLAQKLEWGMTNNKLNYRQVYEISPDGLTETEARQLLNEAIEAGNIIVVIDNIHLYPAFIDILTPYLEASGLQIIGVTDPNGWHSVLKNRSEIVRFMEKVEVSEPQTEDVIRLVAEHLLTYGISF